MGAAFNLTAVLAKIRPVAQQAIDQLITGLAMPCQLVFPGKPTSCINCVWDPIGHKSSNHWRTGGPQPFPANSVCPMCNGKGLIVGEIFLPVSLLCSWEPAKWWVRPPIGIDVPAGSLQTKGFVTDLPRILQSRLLVANTAIQGVRPYRYNMKGEPIVPGNIIQNRYCVCTWERAG